MQHNCFRAQFNLFGRKTFKMDHRYILLLFSIFTTGNSISSKTSREEAEGMHFRSPSSLHSQSYFEYTVPYFQTGFQLKLDFLSFNLDQGPQPFVGDCSTDTLKIVGATNTKNMGPLCGNLTGQQMYLNYMRNQSIRIQVYVSSVSTQDWDILVTEIPYGSENAAPTGCLQYYTEPTGTVMSFNWNNKQQLNLQEYSVCIKSPKGASSIKWSRGGGFNSFFISGIRAIESPDVEKYPDITNPMQGSFCSADWVMIFGVDKFCGNYLNDSVKSSAQPFMLQVRMDSYELPPPGQTGTEADDRNYGFCLAYEVS